MIAESDLGEGGGGGGGGEGEGWDDDGDWGELEVRKHQYVSVIEYIQCT